MDVLETADQLWRGDLDIATHHPFALFGELAEVRADTAFVAAFANSAAFATDDGLVIVDTSSPFLCQRVHEVLSSWREHTAHTIVFTHGHIDHVFGVERYEADAADRGRPAPRVVGHEAIADRFRRYAATAGWNERVNRRQFRANRNFRWPTDYRYPDETYRDARTLEVGGETVELRHARGETDDHTWVWWPARRILCTGDLFIWASPNCGNPQKVQRYPKDWAVALRTMDELGADVLLPGHGYPIVGEGRVHRALIDAATLLESLHDQTVAMMNGGADLDEIVHTVKAPPELLARPYLRPVYDEPEFVVRNVWRLYGGWWDGNPASLKPAPERELARELAALAGGPDRLAARARELVESGDLRLAGHLAEWAAVAEPDNRALQQLRAEVNEARVEDATSTMAKGVFGTAAAESRGRADT
ncbi:MAG: alkyl sulfatase dimerization domain-containing protein [Acidimicrobiia bacterium]